MFVVFDLDGTLADATHREHFVRRPVGEKDWEGFHKASSKDRQKMGVVRTYLALQATGAQVEIWTGRDEKYREQSLKWLSDNGIHEPVLKMRPTGDHTPDDEMKSSWMDEADRPVQMVFEDRKRVVDMWRARGVLCAQVAPGEF